MITVIANLKGGTGKSTLTFNLAVWLCSMKIDVTVIDLDPQKTLTDVAAVRQEDGIDPPIRVQSGPFRDARLPDGDGETLIDVGTADLESFKQALLIADRVVIPTTPSQADIWSTQRFMQFLNKVTQGEPPEAVTFINRADTNPAIQNSDEAAAALTSLPGVRLMPQRLSDRTVFRNSFSEGLAVFELEPRSRGSSEFKVLAEALFRQERFAGQRRRRKKDTPVAVGTVKKERLERLPDDQSVGATAQYSEYDSVADAGADRHGKRAVEGKKKMRKAGEGKKADKGKKRKNRKDGVKKKQAKKEGKNRKVRKGKKGGKGKKSKKGR